MNHLPKGTTNCPCHGKPLLREQVVRNFPRYPATKNSGNKEYYRARCSVDSKNYTVEA